MILAIFGLAVLSVWSLSPVSRDTINVAGLTTGAQAPANDLSNLHRVEFEVIPTLESNEGELQAAYTSDREIVLRSKVNSLKTGETVLGRIELSNSNLFAFPVKVELASFEQSLNDKVVVVLAANNGKHQLNRRASDAEPLMIALPVGEESSALVVELVASEDVNFTTDLEVKISY